MARDHAFTPNQIRDCLRSPSLDHEARQNSARLLDMMGIYYSESSNPSDRAAPHRQVARIIEKILKPLAQCGDLTL